MCGGPFYRVQRLLNTLLLGLEAEISLPHGLHLFRLSPLSLPDRLSRAFRQAVG